MKYVIIGNSAAAVGAVEGIRQTDQQGNITMITAEACHTYSRPLISYLLRGRIPMDKMKYRPDDFYEKNAAKLLYGTVTGIDAVKKTVSLDDGSIIDYDKLLVSTGSVPFVPPMNGLDKVEKKFSFMSLHDATQIDEAISPQSRVLIIGAGLIGLKAAEGIAEKVKSITVVDMADRILPSILDIESSAMVQKHIEKHGVSFILTDSVDSFEAKSAKLKSGKTVLFDILIVAVGVRPNTALVKNAGGDVNRGIKTDFFCRTSLPDVYAAGDCTESFDVSCDQERVLALLPNAYRQGECAGINMAQGSKEYNFAIPMNAIGFFDLHMITAGSYDGEALVTYDDKTYKKLVIKDGLLKGYIMVGEVARAGIYTSLIREKVPLESVDFELLKDKPQLVAFSKEERKKKLARP